MQPLKQYMCVCVFSCVRLFVTPWTVARQAPLSMGFSQQQYWNGFAVPSSKASSRLRDRTHVSYITGGHVTADPPGKPLKTVSHKRNLHKFQRILIIQTVLFDDKAIKLEMYNKSSLVFF